jgi:phospholipid N-methyltransferase
MHQTWTDYRVFWRQFREAYHSTGAVLPSGRALSKALTRSIRESVDGEAASAAGHNETSTSSALAGRRILEVGPGTGAVTRRIVRDMRPSDRLVLVERNDQFIDCLRRQLADAHAFHAAGGRITLVHAPVEGLPHDEPYHLIISGLPLNNFSVQSVEQIFAKLRRLLAPGGTLSFFEYVAVRKAKSLVSRRAERERLRSISRIFRDVLGQQKASSELVLANVPPAWVHHVRFNERVGG